MDFICFFNPHIFLRQWIKPTKMPKAGFEPLTLGVASSDEEHFSMWLPSNFLLFLTYSKSYKNGNNVMVTFSVIHPVHGIQLGLGQDGTYKCIMNTPTVKRLPSVIHVVKISCKLDHSFYLHNIQVLESSRITKIPTTDPQA